MSVIAACGAEPPRSSAAEGWPELAGACPVPGPVLHRADVGRPEALAASPLWRTLDATPVPCRPFRFRTIDLRLGGMTVQSGRSTPAALVGALPPQAAWLLLPLAGAGTLRLCGGRVERHAVAVFGPGAEVEFANAAETRWGLVALPAVEAASALGLGWRAAAMLRPGAAALVRVDPEAWAIAARLVRDVAEVLAADPAVFEIAEARRSLRASVLEACHELLAGPYEGVPPRALPTAAPRLRRMLRAALDHLDKATPPPSRPAALAAAVGVPETRLREAFRAVLGIPAVRYLAARRLQRLRAALAAPGAAPAATGATAAAFGFPSLRGFRRAYRAVFGTDPPRA